MLFVLVRVEGLPCYSRCRWLWQLLLMRVEENVVRTSVLVGITQLASFKQFKSS